MKGVIDGITFIDDYAHHPTEIMASINALKELKYNKMYLIFQPHTYTRTKALFNDFVKVLGSIDNVILAKIYAAREKDLGIVSSFDLMREINKNNKNMQNKNNINNNCECFDNFDEIIEYIVKVAKKDDIVITMGAGDIYKIYDKISLNLK